MEQEQWWYFTFGSGQQPYGLGCYTKRFGTFDSAREAMVKDYGRNWSFQYESAEAAGVTRFNLKEVE